MKFKNWFESESGLGTLPFSSNRGTNTPASDEVRRTGMQPQVDSNETETPEKEETEQIEKIEDKIKDFESEIPAGISQKIVKFKSLWEKFLEKWNKIKEDDVVDELPSEELGLGSATGDPKVMKMLRANPNMAPIGLNQTPIGPEMGN